MLPLQSERTIALDSSDPATLFTVRQITAEEWDVIMAATAKQGQTATEPNGPQAAREKHRVLRESIAGFIAKIQNAYEPGDTITGAAVTEYLGKLNALTFMALQNALTGMADITAIEKKA